jgi:hypothetical protein
MPLRLKPTKPQPPRKPPAPVDEPSLFPPAVPDSPLSYAGWLRTSDDGKKWSPWRRVCQAKKYWDCWPKLLAVEADARIAERAVVLEGEKP